MAKLILDEPKTKPRLVLDEPEGIIAEPNLDEPNPVEIKNEEKEVGDIVDISDNTGVDLFTASQIYPPLSSVIKAIPDPKDISVEAVELPTEEVPMQFEAAEPKKGVLDSLLGFKYPPKPPDWERASLVERFNFITLPISDFLGRIGGKIATDWRMTTKEKVQTTLAHELADDLKWYQKSPEAIGWTGEKVAEYLLLKGVFKASGLHRVLTAAGQKAAAPFLAKEITARGGIKAVSTLSTSGLRNISKKALTSFLAAAPENAAFIGSWSGLEAAIQGESPLGIAEEAKRGAGWGLALTAGLSVIAPVTQAPELRIAFKKAIANIGRRYPGLVDKFGKAPTKEVQKEWLKALSKSRGKDLRLIDLTRRERAVFRNAIRAAEQEVLKAVEKEATIKAYWAAKAAAKQAKVVPEKPAAPVSKEPVKDWLKRSKKLAKGIEKEIKSTDVYQTEILAQEAAAEVFDVGIIYFDKKYKGEVTEAVESHPSLKFHITYDKGKGAPWDGMIQERLGRHLEGVEAGQAHMDVSEFLEKVAEVTEVKEKIGGLNLKALDTLADSGDIKFETLATKYDMIQRGFTAEEINQNIMEISKDYPDVPSDYVESLLIPERGADVTAKPQTVEVKQEIEEAKAESEGLLTLSDDEFTKFLEDDFVPALKAEDKKVKVEGFAVIPKYSTIKEAYNRAHDWILTFGEAKREDPALYNELMSAYGKRNAGVEKAIDQIEQIMPKKITLADDVLLATTYEDKRLSPPDSLKETYDKFANLLDELEKKQLAEGIFQRPFQERMIEENEIKIAKLTEELKHPRRSKQIRDLRDENDKLKNMRYLPHTIVAKRTIETKLNTLKGDKREAFIANLSAFYKKRTGKMSLKFYMVSGLVTQEDIRMSRLATEELADYYVRSANKTLFDYAKAEGYIKPTSESLRAEGWLNQRELGVSALELKDKLVHPLFGSALAEMKAMRKGRGSFMSQIFGMVKIGQFLKPTVIYTYNAVQKLMRGMYSFNPITEAKTLVKATQSALKKDALYHKLNDSNLFQFPYEISRAAREDEITQFIHQHSAEIDKITKIIEKTTDTAWLKPDMKPGEVVKNIIMAAHRAVGRFTWAGDKIQRTQSYLILRKMGYGHDEAVKVAAASHGGYSLLSEKYKKFWSNKLFVYSFRYLMPVEMSKIISEPIIAAKDSFVGAKVPKHKWERMVKAVIGTAFIPLAVDTYMDWRGFEKEGKHLGPLAWKWSKEVMVDGQKREIVVGVNDILNMPVKYWNRITRYNPIRPENRAQQAFENLLKWELHPLYRIFFWDINDNRRSFGTGTEVYDKNANIVMQTGQVAKYIFGQSFRFWGGMMDAVGEGSMTDKERAEQEKIFDSALSGLDRFLFTALGYAYTRQPIEERQAIMGNYLQKELTSRRFEIARKYEGEELEKRIAGLKKWAEKCENWIKDME